AEFGVNWDNEAAFQVGRNAVYLRQYRGWSQARVAKAMGTSQPAIARIEGGDENITLETLRRLAIALEGRLRLALEPSDVNLPRLPPWWTLIGTPMTPSTPLQAPVFATNPQRGVAAVWVVQANTLTSQPLLAIAEGVS